jgi:hypothetical protein
MPHSIFSEPFHLPAREYAAPQIPAGTVQWVQPSEG